MAVLGSLRTGYQTVYLGSIYGRRRWDICIDEYFEEAAAFPGSFRIRLERNLRLQYGQSQNDLWSGKLASALRLRILDFGFSLYNRFINARIEGGDDTKFRCRLRSADGLYKWEGYVRLDTTDRVQGRYGGPPVTEVYAYDGTADLTNLPEFNAPRKVIAPYINASLHNFFRDTLAYMVAPLDIEYRNDIRADNMQAGPSMARLNFSRIRGSIFSPSEIKDLNRQELYDMALQGMLARAWQGLSSGRWHVAGPHLMGINLQGELFSYADFVEEREAFDEVAFADLGSRAYEVAPNAIGRRATVGVYGLFSRLEVDRTSPFAGYSSGFQQSFTFHAQRWNGDTFMYGEQTGDVTFDARGQFNASMKFGPGGVWDLERQIFDANEAVYFSINIVWMAERVAGSGDNTLGFKLWIEAIDPDDSDYYMQDDGTWLAADTTILSNSFAPDGNGADPLTEHELELGTVDPIPVRGRLHFTVIGEANGKNDNILVTRLGIRPLDGDKYDDALEWRTTFRRIDEAGEQVPGDTFSIETDIINLGRFAGDNLDGHVNVFNEDEGYFIQASRFLRAGDHLSTSEAEARFYDLAELWASVIMSDDTARLRRFTGPIRGLWPPELIPVIDCVPYVWLDGDLDLIDEITEARWAQKPGGYQLAT